MKGQNYILLFTFMLTIICCHNSSQDQIVEPKTAIKSPQTLDTILKNNNQIAEQQPIKATKKHKLVFSYYADKKVLSVSKYENGSLIWLGFPTANKDLLVPVKGFIIHRDSVFIQAPYEDGKIWYEGHFCFRESKINKGICTYAYGVHKIYYSNGKLMGTVDYDNEVIEKFDSTGIKLFDAKFNEGKIHRQPISHY